MTDTMGYYRLGRCFDFTSSERGSHWKILSERLP